METRRKILFTFPVYFLFGILPKQSYSFEIIGIIVFAAFEIKHMIDAKMADPWKP